VLQNCERFLPTLKVMGEKTAAGVVALVLASLHLSAQQAPLAGSHAFQPPDPVTGRLEFDVASVKLNKSGERWDRSGGRGLARVSSSLAGEEVLCEFWFARHLVLPTFFWYLKYLKSKKQAG
jgi:hypothetical protein